MNLENLIKDNFAAIIGVFGTLLGVLLGAFLNRISRYGRLKFFINNIDTYYIEEDGFGGNVVNSQRSEKSTDQIININIDIFNTSEYSKKVLRDIKFMLIRKRSSLFDKRNKIEKSYSFSNHMDNINLGPRDIKNLHLEVSMQNDLEIASRCNWYFVYSSISDRRRTVLLNKLN